MNNKLEALKEIATRKLKRKPLPRTSIQKHHVNEIINILEHIKNLGEVIDKFKFHLEHLNKDDKIYFANSLRKNFTRYIEKVRYI